MARPEGQIMNKRLLILLLLLALTILLGVLQKDKEAAYISETDEFLVSDMVILDNCILAESPPTYDKYYVLGSKVAYNGDLSEKRAYYEWIERLAECESSHREDIVILDTNKKYSYGCLQFQKGTWDQYTKRYGLTHLDIMNCEHQKEVASRMLLENIGNWKHWYNCSTKKIGLPS